MKYLVLLLALFMVSNVNAGEECRKLYDLCQKLRDDYYYCRDVERECEKYCEGTYLTEKDARLCETIYRKF